MSDRMDHAAAHERIEDLLLEPSRLAALESSTAADDLALREHLAGCATCAADLESWRRLQVAVNGALPAGMTPDAMAGAVDPMDLPPSLRASVLAAVAGSGREPLPAAPVAPVSIDRPHAQPMPIAERMPRTERMARRPRLSPLVGLAASIALLAGAGVITVDQANQRAAAEASARELSVALAAVDRMLGTEHKIVQLRDTAGQAAGTISWSRHDWVVLTNALPAPPAGSTYRCWLVEGGNRSMAVGQMEFSGDVAYWATSVDQWQTWEINQSTEFIVTLESGAPSSPTGDIVLSARLSS